MSDTGTGDGGTDREPGSDQPGWAAPTPPPSPPTPPPAAPAGFPAPPAYGTPFGTGGTATTRRRRRWPWVLGALLAAIVVLGVTGTVLFVQKIKPPIDAANEFLGDLEDRDFDSAFDQLCSRDQDIFDAEDLGAFFGLGGGFLDDYEINPFDVDVDGDRARVSFDAEGTGDDDYFELPLRKEDGDWRPCLSDDADFRELS